MITLKITHQQGRRGHCGDCQGQRSRQWAEDEGEPGGCQPAGIEYSGDQDIMHADMQLMMVEIMQLARQLTLV